jgi:hypothetical protein
MSLPDHSIPLPPLHEFQALLGVFHHDFVEAFDVDPILFVLVNEELLLLCCLWVFLKQVCHILIVNLEEGAVDFDELPSLLYQSVEQQVDAPRNYSTVVFILLNAPQKGRLLLFSFLRRGFPSDDVAPVASEHSMRLSASSLTVSQNGYIEPL